MSDYDADEPVPALQPSDDDDLAGGFHRADDLAHVRHAAHCDRRLNLEMVEAGPQAIRSTPSTSSFLNASATGEEGRNQPEEFDDPYRFFPW